MNKLIQYCVIVAIGVIVFSTLLIPITNDATNTTKTFVNEGVPFAEPDGETHVIVMDSNGMTTDGQPVNGFEYLYSNSVSILYCDANVVRWSTNGEIQVLGVTNQSGQRRVIGDTDTDTITLTINNNVATFVNGEATTILSGAVLAYPTSDENAKYRQGTEHYYTDDTDLIIAGGFSNNAIGGQVALVMTGTVDNLAAPFVWYYSVPATVDNIDVQTSNVTTNLNKIDKILVTMDVTATDDTYNLTYTQFLSEATGTYENPTYSGEDLAQIIGVIPLIVIVGLIAGIVGVIAIRRNA